MSKSNYLELKILDGVLGGPDFARPATVYVAAYTAAPSDAGGGTELAGSGYARVAVANNSANWPAAAVGDDGASRKSNGALITFPDATADWGTVVALGVFDAASGGNLLYWGALLFSKYVATGQALRILVGEFKVTED